MTTDQTHIIKTNIIPQLLLRKKKLYKITSIPEHYRIREYEITTSSNRIREVHIRNTFHPNACNGVWDGTITPTIAPPPKAKFCLPQFLKDKELSESILFAIERFLSIINYDDSYYIDYNINYSDQGEC